MRGFGSWCPYCRAPMITRGHWWISDSQRVAIVMCLFHRCHFRARLKIKVSPLRRYRKKGADSAKRAQNKPHAPRPNHAALYSTNSRLNSDTYGLGERCPKCDRGMFVRSSRHIGRNRKVFYLDCPSNECGTRQRVDLTAYEDEYRPGRLYRGKWPPIPFVIQPDTSGLLRRVLWMLDS